MSASDNTAATELKAKRNKRLALFAAIAVTVGAASAGYWTLHASHFVSTDNAYANAEVALVTPSVGGTVLEVRARDTQLVKKGDVLVVIDPADAKLALAQAEAELGRAVRRVHGMLAQDGGLASQVAANEARMQAAQADFERARIDLQRREALVGSGSVSAEEVTSARNAFAAARAALVAARADRGTAVGAKEANAAMIRDTSVDQNPEVALARARRDQARIDLARTVVRAPLDGVVARRQVQLGQRVQAGVALMSIVPVDQIYVDANFKEVQLKKVRIGQPVELHADLYGKDVTYRGVVEGFSGGSGAAFAAIPAQNATGNWIKVVQRVPVRIKLEPAQLQSHPLKVGLSMSAEIDTRQRQG